MTNAETAPRPGHGRDPSFDPAGQSKRLLRKIRTAILGALNEDVAFATLTAIATNYDGSLILLVSRLAGCRRNLERGSRCLCCRRKAEAAIRSRIRASLSWRLRSEAPSVFGWI